jgi:hypothetical protein
VKAIADALKKVVKFKQSHKNWKVLMNSATSVLDLGISNVKVLKLLDSHEELSDAAGQIRFLIEYMRLAAEKYGEPE